MAAQTTNGPQYDADEGAKITSDPVLCPLQVEGVSTRQSSMVSGTPLSQAQSRAGPGSAPRLDRRPGPPCGEGPASAEPSHSNSSIVRPPQGSGNTGSMSTKRKKPRGLNILQLNAHKSSSSVACLQKLLCQNNALSIALVQEPWQVKGVVKGLNNPNHTVFHAICSPGVSPRAALVCPKELNPVFLSQLSTPDITAVQITLSLAHRRTRPVVLVSAYLPGDEPIPQDHLRRIQDFCNSTKSDLLLGGDINAHHTVWCSTDNNPRGEEMLDLLTELDWHLLNTGGEPTFLTKTRSEVLDVTVCSPSLAPLINDWHVSDEVVLSDHRLIRCKVAHTKTTVQWKRRVQNTNWELYGHHLQSQLPPLTTPQNSEEVEQYAQKIERAIISSFESACQAKRVSSRKSPPWWNFKTAPELKRLRQQAHEAFKVFRGSRSPEDFESSRAASRLYMSLIRRAKRETWKQFCQDIESYPETSRISKILRNGPRVSMGLLDLPSGKSTNTTQETIKHLLDVHFPNCVVGGRAVEATRTPTTQDRTTVDQFVTRHSILGAIKTLSPYKAPGTDGIFPVLLQRGGHLLVPHLLKLYKASFLFGYLPLSWREAKVVFIPKPGKPTYAKAKSWRPISLTSFMLKVAEKLVDRFLKMRYLVGNPLHQHQHAYQAGKSTETALNSALGIIQSSLDNKEYALACFLDIQGAFDNAQFTDIRKALEKRQVAPILVDWAMNTLQQRTVTTTVADVSCTALTTQGTAQGGVLSALWFVLVVDELLVQLNTQRYFTVGYSDDTTIILRGPCLRTLCELMQNALDIVTRWCQSAKMSVSAEKTQLMLFTRKYKPNGYKPIWLNSVQLTYADQVKYLGLHLTPKLLWNVHIQQKCEAARKVLWQCRQTMRCTWGLNPKLTKWLYESVARSLLTYGCLFWAYDVSTKQVLRKHLNKVQRLGCLMVTSALKTTPLVPMEVISGILPIDLYIQYRAACTAYRLSALGYGPRKGHARTGFVRTWNDLQEIRWLDKADYIPAWLTPTPTFYWLEEGLKANSQPEGESCYSYGYEYHLRDIHQVGGAYSTPMGVRTFVLPTHCTAWQAEQRALIQLCEEIVTWPRGHVTIILSGWNVWKALQKYKVVTQQLKDLWKALLRISSQHNLKIGYVEERTHERFVQIVQSADSARLNNHTVVVPCNPLIQWVYKRLLNRSWKIQEDRWLWDDLHRQSHLFLGRQLPSARKTAWILSLPRSWIFTLVGVLTGHNALNRHLSIMGCVTSEICDQCNLGQPETATHYICDCPGYSRLRREVYGQETIAPIVSGEHWEQMLQFILYSARFECATIVRNN